MNYKSYMLRTVAVALLLVVSAGMLIAEDVSQDRKKIYQAKDLMFESSYQEAYKLFMEVYKDQASGVRDEALYYAARCLYNMNEMERAKAELLRFEEEIDESRWSDDVAELLNEINRSLGEKGDLEAVLVNGALVAESVARVHEETVAVAEQAEEIARQAIVSRRGGISVGGSKYDDEDCNDPQGKKEAALNALIHVEEERAVDIVEKFLSMNPCDKLKAKALFVLSQHESKRSLDLLVDVAKNDKSLEIRKEALFWVGQFDDEMAADILISMFDEINDTATKKHIVFALSQQDDEESMEKLITIAKSDPDGAVRKSAIHWVAQLDDEERVVDAMKEIYNNSGESFEVRKDVLFALSQIESKESFEMLMDLAKREPERELRKNAIFWLGHADDKRAADRLVELYSEESDLEVKSQILFALGNLDEVSSALPHLRKFFDEADSVELKKKITFTLYRISEESDAVIDVMIELYEKETDPEVRKNLLFYISQSDNPKAEEYLLQNIESDLIG